MAEEQFMIDEEDPNLGGTPPPTQQPIDYWKNMDQAPTGGSGPSGYPAYGTPEWFKYFLNMDPSQSQPIIDAQQQGQQEFAAGQYGGPAPSAASEPNQNSYYTGDGSAGKSPEQIAAEEARDAAAGGGQQWTPEQQAAWQAGQGGGGGSFSATSSTGVGQPRDLTAPQMRYEGGPNIYTTEGGVQDQLLQQLMDRMQQGTEIDPNDPNIRQQLDPYAAAQERARRDAVSDYAERAGALATGAQRGQERMMAENAGQNVGQLHAQLVGQELRNRRDEIRQSLEQVGNMLNEDQKRQLQRELANLDAELKTMGIESAERLGFSELNLKDKLGTAGLNVDLMGLLLRNQQFGDQLGFDIADREAYWNADAYRQLLA